MAAARRRRAARGAPGQAEQSAARFPVRARLNTRDIYASGLSAREGDDLTALAASIARRGLLCPLIVRRNEEAGRYALVSGARRLAACRQLGVEEVDAVILEGDERDALACYLEEHWTRRDAFCADEAEAIARLGGREVAERMAIGGRGVARRLRLRLLGARVLAAARASGLTLEQLEPLLCVPDEALRLEAASIIASRGLTGAQARRLVMGAPEGGGMPVPGRAGRRHARLALGELSAALSRLSTRGVETAVSVRSQEDGLLVRILVKNGEESREKTREKA